MFCGKCQQDKSDIDFSPHQRRYKFSRWCKSCYNAYRRENWANNRERLRLYYRQRLFRLKIETIQAYGGKCRCCGETQVHFLAIDHINGGGRKHRRDIKKPGGVNFYGWLKRRRFPQDEYQLLCFNCNAAKGTLGHCPHEESNGHAKIVPAQLVEAEV